MLILTTSGEAINAQHAVRFFVQPNTTSRDQQDAPTRCRLVVQLSNRQKIIAAELSCELQARALFREVVRQRVCGHACIDVTACLKRIEKGEQSGNGWTGVCL